MTRLRTRSVTPSVVARWLEVKEETVTAWIRMRDLPALNIGTTERRRYIIFLKDLAPFLVRRGLSHDRVHELLGGGVSR